MSLASEEEVLSVEKLCAVIALQLITGVFGALDSSTVITVCGNRGSPLFSTFEALSGMLRCNSFVVISSLISASHPMTSITGHSCSSHRPEYFELPGCERTPAATPPSMPPSREVASTVRFPGRLRGPTRAPTRHHSGPGTFFAVTGEQPACFGLQTGLLKLPAA